jgi:hypothetical protein
MPATAYPPSEAVVLAVVILSYCMSCVAEGLKTIDTVATIDVISTPLFEDKISKYSLGCIRVSFAVIFLLTSIYRFLKTGHNLEVPYVKNSKLKRTPINLDGLRSQIMFTQWSWNLLTISFGLNGYIAFRAARADEEGVEPSLCSTSCSPQFEQYILRAAIFLFEIAAPSSLIVSSISKYVLWPQAMKSNPNGSKSLQRPVALLQHNFNNVSTLLEAGVLGSIPVRIEDCIIAVIYGIVYLFFTWSIAHSLLPSREPQYIYFFFDTTLSKKWIIGVMLGLLFILLVYFLAFTLIDDILQFLGGSLPMNCLVILTFSSMFCRFRD